MQSSERDRFDALLPFYITNQLSSEEQMFVRNYIGQNSDAKSAVCFAEQLVRVIRSTGSQRNPEIVLARLLANFNQLPKPSLWRRTLLHFRALGISHSVAVILLAAMISAAGGFAIYKFNAARNHRSAASVPTAAHLSATFKRGVDVTLVVAIVERFGGRVIQSDTGGEMEKIFINLVDRSEIQGLVDALMSSGLIEAAVILL